MINGWKLLSLGIAATISQILLLNALHIHTNTNRQTHAHAYEHKKKWNEMKWNCVYSVAWQTMNRLIACGNEIYIKFLLSVRGFGRYILLVSGSEGVRMLPVSSGSWVREYTTTDTDFYVFAWKFVVSNFVSAICNPIMLVLTRTHTCAEKYFIKFTPRSVSSAMGAHALWYSGHGHVYLLFLLILCFIFHVDVMIFLAVFSTEPFLTAENQNVTFNGTRIKHKYCQAFIKRQRSKANITRNVYWFYPYQFVFPFAFNILFQFEYQ